MDEVFVKQVIICTKQRRGKGIEYSPIRIITEVFDLDGKLIADSDPVGNINPEVMLDFLKWHYKDISEEQHRDRISQYFTEEWREEQKQD